MAGDFPATILTPALEPAQQFQKVGNAAAPLLASVRIFVKRLH
jgi:hypothetical protein